jgi:hypothetical protein
MNIESLHIIHPNDDLFTSGLWSFPQEKLKLVVVATFKGPIQDFIKYVPNCVNGGRAVSVHVLKLELIGSVFD